jgi:hypothetical protein
VNQSSRVPGCQSKPTVLRTPRATISKPEPSAGDGGVGIGAVADVARRADGHVEQAVRPEGDELPTVMAVAREIPFHHHRRGRALQPSLDGVVTEDAADLGDVE